MLKKIGSLLATGLGLVLLVYSAARSLDFIMLTLPADKQALAYFGLAALDGGLVAWLLAYLHGSRGGWQRGISLMMIVVDFAGCVTMFTLDTLYNAGKAGMTVAMTADEMQTAVLALSAIIALNIGATVGHHLTDPDNLKAQAEEEAQSTIEDMALKQVREQAGVLAARIAPAIAGEWRAQTEAKYASTVKASRQRTQELSASLSAPALPIPADNNQVYPADTGNATNPTQPRKGKSG